MQQLFVQLVAWWTIKAQRGRPAMLTTAQNRPPAWAFSSQVRGQQKQYQPLGSPGSSNRNFKKKPCFLGDIKVIIFSFLILWIGQIIESLCFIRKVNKVYFFRTWSE